ncbi:hypothetical protein PROFUN_02020 [Planoprotostelium fungivorum]|uniref:Uncharacterized protein n=1 Tax=Planoprotostelium fungivorum TaxID=1890364 RepID=A0A2P6NB60_9EUKA|nr:hypothetical protein PROFUN_02020 [Planoprotostelium fungivorum]
MSRGTTAGTAGICQCLHSIFQMATYTVAPSRSLFETWNQDGKKAGWKAKSHQIVLMRYLDDEITYLFCQISEMTKPCTQFLRYDEEVCFVLNMRKRLRSVDCYRMRECTDKERAKDVVEDQGIDPCAPRMLSECSTI